MVNEAFIGIQSENGTVEMWCDNQLSCVSCTKRADSPYRLFKHYVAFLPLKLVCLHFLSW